MLTAIGIYACLLLTGPTVNPVNPAMAPCTALWARRVQYTLSEALLGTARIMYVGSAARRLQRKISVKLVWQDPWQK